MAALAGALIVSARLTVSAAALRDLAWVGFVSLLPLFAAMRFFRPLVALTLGALWGLSVFVFGVLTPNSGIPPTILAGQTLTIAPALYACGGAWLTRRIGFSPLVLSVAWMFVELLLAPLGPHHGLLASTQGDGWLLHVMGRLFGYLLVAFFVAYVSAWLATALAKVRLRTSTACRRVAATERIELIMPQIPPNLRFSTIAVSQPRAPPA